MNANTYLMPSEEEIEQLLAEQEAEKSPEQLAEEQQEELAEMDRLYWEEMERLGIEGQAKCDQVTLEEDGELAVLYAQFEKWLAIEEIDRAVIDFALAIYLSHQGTISDPIWGIIVGPSGGGKSELLKTLLDDPMCYHLSKVTPNTLASGFRKPKSSDNAGEDPSLLKQINGKILLIPDLAPILSLKPEARKEVMATFRESYDGIVMSGKGNTGRTSYSSKFSFLTASTYAIDTLGAEINELGERFIRIRMRGNNGRAKGRKAGQNSFHVDQMRSELKKAVSQFTAKRRASKPSTRLSDEIRNEVTDIAYVTARARTIVTRDRYRREIEFTPVAEDPGRLAIQLIKLITAVAMVHGHATVNQEDLKFVQRVADDCLPPDRLKVIEVLRKRAGYSTVQEVARTPTTWLPETTVRRVLEDLEQLEVVERDFTSVISATYRLKPLPKL